MSSADEKTALIVFLGEGVSDVSLTITDNVKSPLTDRFGCSLT
jgi:hypothetical protein